MKLIKRYDWDTELKIIVALLIIALVAIVGYKATETETETRCCVTDCVYISSDIYEVGVVTPDGNEYAYYDDTPKENGEVIVCVFNGNQEIIEAKEVR